MTGVFVTDVVTPEELFELAAVALLPPPPPLVAPPPTAGDMLLLLLLPIGTPVPVLLLPIPLKFIDVELADELIDMQLLLFIPIES